MKKIVSVLLVIVILALCCGCAFYNTTGEVIQLKNPSNMYGEVSLRFLDHQGRPYRYVARIDRFVWDDLAIGDRLALTCGTNNEGVYDVLILNGVQYLPVYGEWLRREF